MLRKCLLVVLDVVDVLMVLIVVDFVTVFIVVSNLGCCECVECC